MKNITVSVDEGTYRIARVRAAELDTSVSALVRGYLESLVKDGEDVRSRAELQRRDLDDVLADFAARGVGLRMSDNLSREELYDRDRARAEAEMGRKRGSLA